VGPGRKKAKAAEQRVKEDFCFFVPAARTLASGRESAKDKRARSQDQYQINWALLKTDKILIFI
jgi:hypothetical protein